MLLSLTIGRPGRTRKKSPLPPRLPLTLLQPAGTPARAPRRLVVPMSNNLYVTLLAMIGALVIGDEAPRGILQNNRATASTADGSPPRR